MTRITARLCVRCDCSRACFEMSASANLLSKNPRENRMMAATWMTTRNVSSPPRIRNLERVNNALSSILDGDPIHHNIAQLYEEFPITPIIYIIVFSQLFINNFGSIIPIRPQTQLTEKLENKESMSKPRENHSLTATLSILVQQLLNSSNSTNLDQSPAPG